MHLADRIQESMPIQNTIHKDDVTLVILAGGRGQRMDGQDKGLIAFNNRPLIETVLESVRRQSGNIVINANRNLDQYQRFGLPLIEDELTGYQGPLAGMLAAMHQVNTPYILTLPCDGPFIADDYVDVMISKKQETGAEIVVASDGERLQPVFALLDTALQNSLEDYLNKGDRKIDRWYAMHHYTEAVFDPDSRLFTNLNTPNDFLSLES